MFRRPPFLRVSAVFAAALALAAPASARDHIQIAVPDGVSVDIYGGSTGMLARVAAEQPLKPLSQ